MTLTILRVLLLRLRNSPLELLLVFVMPVVFFSIFAWIFSKGISTGGDSKLRLGWICPRETPLSNELLMHLQSNSALECSSLIGELSRVTSEDSGRRGAVAKEWIEIRVLESQRSGRYDLIVRIPDGFPTRMSNDLASSSCAVQLVTDGQNPMAVAMVTSLVRGFFEQKKADFVVRRMMAMRGGDQVTRGSRDLQRIGPGDQPQTGSGRSARHGDDPSAAGGRRYLEPIRGPSQNVGSDPEQPWLVMDASGAYSIDGETVVPGEAESVGTGEASGGDVALTSMTGEAMTAADTDIVNISIQNPQAATQENPRIAMYAAGIAVLFLLFSATGNAAVMLEEAESGTLDRILVSQAELVDVIAGKWLGIFLLGCLQITVMFIWAELIFGIQLASHLAGFCIMTTSTAAATASFAMLLATLCRSRAQLHAISTVIILSMSAVGGSMIPRFAMSDRMKEFGRWTFNAWALDGYQKVFWFQSPLSSLKGEVAVLLASSVLFGTLAILCSGRWKRG